MALADGVTGRLSWTRPIVRTRRLDIETFSWSHVVMTTRGEVAWIAGPRLDDFAVTYLPPGGSPVELDRGRVRGLRLDDDGTLVWRRQPGRVFADDAISYDLPGRDFGAGCPKRRTGFSTVLDAAGVVFTQRSWRTRYATGTELRACDPATGRDAIVGHASSSGGDQQDLRPVGGGNGWAAMSLEERFPRDECGLVRLLTVEIATGRAGRRTTRSGCRGGFVGVGFPRTVVTSNGVPAFVEDGRLLAVGAESADGENGRLVELDRGDIRDLRAEGDDVAWTNGGEARRARP